MGTSTSAGYKSSYTGDQIDAAIAQVDTNKTDIENLKKSISQNYINTTHANLLTLISGNKLVPCAWYHITDYCASYGLFVMANSTSSLSGIAYPDVNNGALYYEYDVNQNREESATLKASKGIVTKCVCPNNNILGYDFYNSKITVNISKSIGCSCEFDFEENVPIFNSCINCKIGPGCNNIILNSCTDIYLIGSNYNITVESGANLITIMPGVRDLVVTADMSNSVISINTKTDTINIIRD